LEILYQLDVILKAYVFVVMLIAHLILFVLEEDVQVLVRELVVQMHSVQYIIESLFVLAQLSLFLTQHQSKDVLELLLDAQVMLTA
jgi:hypothetical protein